MKNLFKNNREELEDVLDSVINVCNHQIDDEGWYHKGWNDCKKSIKELSQLDKLKYNKRWKSYIIDKLFKNRREELEDCLDSVINLCNHKIDGEGWYHKGWNDCKESIKEICQLDKIKYDERW